MDTLTDSEIKIVNRLRRYYVTLLDAGYTEQNAHDKVVFDNGNVDYLYIAIATKRSIK